MVPAGQRKKGVGTGLVQHVLLLADQMKKPVRVSARPIGSMSPESLQRLVQYYERLGFREIDRGLTVVHMLRNGD